MTVHTWQRRSRAEFGLVLECNYFLTHQFNMIFGAHLEGSFEYPHVLVEK